MSDKQEHHQQHQHHHEKHDSKKPPEANTAPKKDWKKIGELETKNITHPAPEKQEEAEEKHTMELERLSPEQLEAKLNETEKKLDEIKNKWLSAQAEIVNIQRIRERDVSNAHKYGQEKLISELLPIIDNLERSVEVPVPENNDIIRNLRAGVELTLKMFLDALAKFAVTQVNPIGEVFNPIFHTAMTVQEDNTVKPNTILQVLQKGYMLKDRLLRPAAVIVSKTKG